MRQFLYLDSSALVKLVIHEAESIALRRFLKTAPALISSVLAAVEVRRAIRRSLPTRIPTARGKLVPAESVLSVTQQVMEGVSLVHLDRQILTMAAELGPDKLRSLDALHLASALSLRSDIEAMVVYDKNLAEAATHAGLDVVSPR